MNIYKTAIIGNGYAKTGLLDYINTSDRYQLCAVYDKNKIKCNELANEYSINGYDDSRQLILSEKPDIIILNIPNYQTEECIHSAISHNCNILKLSPPARELSELQGWIHITSKSNCAFAIGCRTRNNPITDTIFDIVNNQKLIGTIYHSTIENFFQFDGMLDWRGEPNLSGGGVLLEGNFDYIDFLNRLHGLPKRVFAVTTDLCKKASIPPYLTEDTALLTFEYGDQSIASISCGWMAGTSKLSMTFYGTEGSIHFNGEKLVIFNRQNEIINEIGFVDQDDSAIIDQLEAFANHLDNRDFTLNNKAESYLNTLAIINTAYLSATTKSPEEPHKLIDHM